MSYTHKDEHTRIHGADLVLGDDHGSPRINATASVMVGALLRTFLAPGITNEALDGLGDEPMRLTLESARGPISFFRDTPRTLEQVQLYLPGTERVVTFRGATLFSGNGSTAINGLNAAHMALTRFMTEPIWVAVQLVSITSFAVRIERGAPGPYWLILEG